ncbi:beta-mannosidase [Proteiniphilum sp. UBA1028]|uniref:beta-mannosidase n=1 Tax=Proteiniphilum sp. UBA1028 TaxID=1947251 RepID=UPI0025E7A0B8|nr:glycoside hydrolase family 2 protein [Proteiniphilum sp. UBA1028]
MRKSVSFLFFLISCMLTAQQSELIPLNEGWQFAQADKATHSNESGSTFRQWYAAEVPGSVQRDLIRHGVLPDPYYGTNEKQVQWVEDENWDFKKSFTVTADQLKYDEAVIFFEGLDTHADVFLNGARILQTNNMFTGHKIPVKNVLVEGENRLYIRFYSPIQRMMPARATFGYDYPAGNDHREEKLSIYNRKAPYHFGWDWGIRMVQMGIWKPVSVLFFDDARIDDYYVKQVSVNAQQARIDNQIEIISVAEQPVHATLSVAYRTKESEPGKAEKKVTLRKGKNIVSLPLEITAPRLWMPAHWGEQHLYDFTAQVLVGDSVVAEKTVRTGLRSIRHITKEDAHGSSFYFEVNGIPLFAKGSNYIPGEILTTQQDSAYYTKIFDHIEGAHMNMVRVWGGGIYENEAFYQEADERGILVWQDFIFGCTPYPSDDAFLASVKEEAVYNIKRLRNHASLAYWCGNNEVLEGLHYWGWDKQYPKAVMDAWFKGYDKTFREMIPALVKEYDGTRDYTHGSPDVANWGRPHLFNRGDVHDWGLWYGELPFEAMAGRLPRFASEFGFQSFPEMKTIRTFAEPDQWSLESEVMKVHQKASTGNALIKKYMDMYYHEPKSFEDFVYVGLVMQGNGMEESVEAMRRGRPYCMGALYWQINDSWPVVSWSSIDYYDNWKAQHYRMRDVFAPLALGIAFKEDTLQFYTMSDHLEDRNNLLLTVQLIDFTTGKQREIKEKVHAMANTSNIVMTLAASSLLNESDKANKMIHAFLGDSRGNVISSKDYFFYWPNKLNLPETKIDTKVHYADGEYTIILSSCRLAKDVFVEIPVQGARFSDNFINLLPGEKRTIVIRSPRLKAADRTPVTVKHIRETY